MERVVEVEKINWTFDNQGPYIRNAPPGCHPSWIAMDPTPAYSHPRERVIAAFEKCEAVFKIPIQVWLYNIHFENIGRTNGETRTVSDYTKKTKQGDEVYGSAIYLFGKRTPIHPAQTRYLVTHEYGHAVDHITARARFKGSSPWENQREEYMELRKIPRTDNYGPGTWHLQSAEVFANDFRFLVAQVEQEFWPHPFPTPDTLPEIIDFWDRMKTLDLSSALPVES